MWRAGEKGQALIQCSESHGGAPNATAGLLPSRSLHLSISCFSFSVTLNSHGHAMHMLKMRSDGGRFECHFSFASSLLSPDFLPAGPGVLARLRPVSTHSSSSSPYTCSPAPPQHSGRWLSHTCFPCHSWWPASGGFPN